MPFYLQVMYGPKNITDLVDNDEAIRAIAVNAGGREVGAGYFTMLGWHDIEFEFVNLPDPAIVVQLNHSVPDLQRVVMFKGNRPTGTRGECVYRWETTH